MAQKPVKKTAAKPAATKKATVKKVAPKKAAQKAVKQTAAEKKVVMPAEMHHECNCGKDCACARKSARGFGRFLRKLIFALIIFALGFAAAKMYCCDRRPMRGARVHFVNGCLDTASVKCPKMQEMLPMMDANQDNCISREEYKAVKKEMRRQMRA